MSKQYPEVMAWNDLLQYLKKSPVAHIATIDNDHPRVRMMALNIHDNRIWLATHAPWNKVKELKRNNNVELSIGIRGEKGSGAARISGVAICIEDESTRKELTEAISWFSSYWPSHNSERFTLYRIDINRVLIDHPDDGLKYHTTDYPK